MVANTAAAKCESKYSTIYRNNRQHLKQSVTALAICGTAIINDALSPFVQATTAPVGPRNGSSRPAKRSVLTDAGSRQWHEKPAACCLVPQPRKDAPKVKIRGSRLAGCSLIVPAVRRQLSSTASTAAENLGNQSSIANSARSDLITRSNSPKNCCAFSAAPTVLQPEIPPDRQCHSDGQ